MNSPDGSSDDSKMQFVCTYCGLRFIKPSYSYVLYRYECPTCGSAVSYTEAREVDRDVFGYNKTKLS